MTPALVDEYGPMSFVWLRVVSFAGEVEQVHPLHRKGTPPPALEDEIANIGWSFLLDIRTAVTDLRGVTFLTRHGLAPFQPFKLRVSAPVYWKDEDGEWSCDIEVEIVDKALWPAAKVLAAWAAECNRCGVNTMVKP